MRRRTFVRSAAAAATGSLLAPGLALGADPGAPSNLGGAARRRRADLVLRGATLFDGTGAPGREADVAITGDRISEVGAGLAAGSEEIDVRGLALAPGFIDIHSHADMSLFVNPNAESRVRQGVTLEVAGQDGGSIGPWSEAEFRQTRDRYRERYGADIDFRDPAGFLDGIDRLRPAVNVATMVGNGALRGYVVGNANRRATPAELERMKAELRRAINGGCVGLSSGLEYTPSGFADPDELIALASVLRGTGYPYCSHMRNEDDRLLAAVEETLHIGRMAGVPVQVSHLKAQGTRNHWKQDAVLGLFEEANRAGVDARFDCYPYVAYQTGLTNLFPTEMRAGGSAAFLRRLREAPDAAALEAACRAKIALLGDWNAVQITSAGSTPWAVGRKLGDLAAARGVEPYALTVQLLEENGGSVGMIGFGMSEQNVARLLAHPLGMVCSDGGNYAPYGALSESAPHPRGYGTFPRVLGHYVRERGALPLELAIHKMTGVPAARLGLEGRGVVAPGAWADLVAFDPVTVIDRATFDNAHQYPVGVTLVVVNGVVTIRDAEQTGQRGGRAVRGSARV